MFPIRCLILMALLALGNAAAAQSAVTRARTSRSARHVATVSVSR